jgi:hypothetical protein
MCSAAMIVVVSLFAAIIAPISCHRNRAVGCLFDDGGAANARIGEDIELIAAGR